MSVALDPPMRVAVLTVSDRCSRGETVDTAGPAVLAFLESELGATSLGVVIVPDEVQEIRRQLLAWRDAGVELSLTAGGTGCAARDITPEATLGVIDREVPGLAEEMRRRSLRVTPHALLSRAVCGISGRMLIVNLPGSRKGAVENLGAIAAALPHAVRHLRGDSAHPEADAGRQRDGS